MSKLSEPIRQVTLIGLPESGKTSYLSGLLNAIENDTSEALEDDWGVERDMTVYHSIAQWFQEGRYPSRTPHAGELRLPLRLSATSESFTLTLLDTPGESVTRDFDLRLGQEVWHDSTPTHMMLVLRPRHHRPPRTDAGERTSWDEQWVRLRARLGLGGFKEDESGKARATSLAALSPEAIAPILPETSRPRRSEPGEAVRVPTQLALIEALQLHRHARGWAPVWRPSEEQLRIAVVVSAWDAVGQAWRDKGPRSFLMEHAPLLEDFLASNFHSDAVCRFGVSASGGDLNDKTYKKAFLNNPKAEVVYESAAGEPETSHDLGLPIAWLLRGDVALRSLDA